jgi:hypothetical protein
MKLSDILRFLGKWIKPLWKSGLKLGVQQCGDWLQEKAKQEIQKDLRKVGDRLQPLIDEWQGKISSLLGSLPLPKGYEVRLKAGFNIAIDQLQKNLSVAVDLGSLAQVNPAVDRAFDQFQLALITRIENL